MTNKYQEAYAEMPNGSDINDLDVWAFKHRNAIRKALELAIALQPKPISEVPLNTYVIVTEDDKHFYDISALPKPEEKKND